MSKFRSKKFCILKYIFVSFDISKNKIRNEINKKMKKIGLKNIQYSVFLGGIEEKAIETIIDFTKDTLEVNDKLCILEIDKDMLDSIYFFDKNYDINYILNKKNIEFF